jgi:diketogulonate reductase-like aldo/keto reductase
VLDYCQKNDVMLVALRPVYEGKLTENELLIKLAQIYKKTIYQLAINWLVSQKNVVTLVKTSNINHLDENLGALGWQMEGEDIELVLRNYPEQIFKSANVPLDLEGSLPA